MLKEKFAVFCEEAEDWAKGKSPYLRALLWFFFLYIFLRHIFSLEYHSIFWGINLGIHELGHIILSFMPTLIMVLGGTIFQLAAPIASIFMFLSQRDYFALTFSFGWLSTSLFEVAIYAGDAQKQMLPLVSPFGGEDIIHDWNYILGKLGLLSLTPLVSAIFWLLAIFSMLISLSWGGWLLFLMFKKK